MDLHMCTFTRKGIEKNSMGTRQKNNSFKTFFKKYMKVYNTKKYIDPHQIIRKRMSLLLLSEPDDLKRSFRICLLLLFSVSTLVDYQSANHDLASTFCLHTRRTCGSA